MQYSKDKKSRASFAGRPLYWVALTALVLTAAACGGGSGRADTTPDAFTFIAVTDVQPGQVVTSNEITVSGINAPAPISVSSSGSLRIDDMAADSDTVTDGQRVAVEVRSSPDPGTTVTATVTIGGVSAPFRVTTAAGPVVDTTPHSFSFAALGDQEVDVTVTSNAVTVRGIDAPAPLTVTGQGTLLLDGAESAAATVTAGQTVALRMRTSKEYSTPVSATLTIGGVSATFTATTREAPPTIRVTNLDDSGPGSLRQAVLDIENGGLIRFAAGLTGEITLLSQVYIDKSLTIEGPGVDAMTLSGDRQNRLFYIGGETLGVPLTVTINRLRLTQGNITGSIDRSGGAIRVEEGSLLRLLNSAITDSEASQSGGAIVNLGGLLIEDSVIEGNHAHAANNGCGGAIYTSGEIQINRSRLTNNRSSNSGGAICGFGALVMVDSEVSTNSSSGAGGGIYAGQGTIVELIGAFIHSNTAAGHGGGIYANEASLSITGSSRINSNSLISSANRSGGGIYSYRGSLLIQDSELLNNQATTSSNYSGGAGGALMLDGTSDPRVIRTRFANNRAQQEGGAIAIRALSSPRTVTVEQSQFIDNTARLGGGIFYSSHNNNEYRIESSTFSNNSATAGEGGALYWRNGGQGQIRNSTFVGNTASGNGGAVWTSRTTTVIESTIVRNQAAGLGDGISASQLTLRNSIVALNGDTDITGLTSAVNTLGNNFVGNGHDTGLVSGSNRDIVGSIAAPLDPQLGVLADNGGPTQTIAPLSGSPVIGHIPLGMNFSTVDQRGQPRPGSDGVSDIGAFESQ